VIEYTYTLLLATRTTIFLTITSFLVALFIGFLLAFARLDKKNWYFWPAQGVVQLIRSTPLLLQLFYLFYVLPFVGIRIDPFPAAILGLGINYGAYMSEVIRSGIVAVNKGQWEAAYALGMSQSLAMRRIVLPTAIRIIIPPLGNYLVSLFKDTALVATISISELLFTARLLAAQTFHYFEIFTITFFMYFAISYPAAKLVALVEKRLRIAP